MAKKRWERFVEGEYLEADYDFVENVLPLGTIDGSSFGLIADATEYSLVKVGGEVHLRPEVYGLDSLLSSLRRGGVAVDKRDALLSVERFAALWEEKIKSKGKWERLLQLAEEEGAILSGPRPGPTPAETETKTEKGGPGWLRGLLRRFRRD